MEQPENNRWNSLAARIVSGIVLLATALTVIMLGGWAFGWLVVIAGLLMIGEWQRLTASAKPYWMAIGMLYISIPCACLLWLRNLEILTFPAYGLHAVLFVMVCVWATDIGAYFTGRAFGKTPLAPDISPKKTWEGLGGGVVSAMVCALLVEYFFPLGFSVLKIMALAAMLALVGQAGDLFESWMKRRAGVKDSGTLIPGHGGVLDRLDGLMFAVPMFSLMVWLGPIGA